ncbi:glycosyltransferase [Terriglobus albidus]|uniref:Glycosyltransferase n=1 Tax=Terriglobus albidus TaxID=1592106 RepID=A0A5B9E776_9BACT|nr:glycosyltransferase [Terriglobus albidus]QEE27908.1 glycosyltransferase [Terriglobus albidus]
MIIFLAAVCCAAWLYLLALHGRFWSSGPVLRESKTPCADAKVAVVVPARDEAENIGRSLSSLLAQQYPGALSIILVDDNNADGTAEIAASLLNQGRLTIVSGQPLPAGWSGKLWAVHQGLVQPEAQSADYILLTDADIEHASTHVAMLVHEAEANGRDLVSEMVRLHCSTPAERALIPAFIFFFQMLYPFAWVADPRRTVAGAAGGTMLVRRTALERVDGVRRIQHHLIDDCALARQIKSSGGKIWLGHAELARSLRVYADWREVWNMIARTAYVQLGHSPLMLLGCIAGMGLLYVAPVLLALFGHGLTSALAAAAWLMMVIALQPTLRRYRRSPLWGVALPGIAMFYLGATVASAFRHYMGRGGGWKNRTYPEAPST